MAREPEKLSVVGLIEHTNEWKNIWTNLRKMQLHIYRPYSGFAQRMNEGNKNAGGHRYPRRDNVWEMWTRNLRRL